MKLLRCISVDGAPPGTLTLGKLYSFVGVKTIDKSLFVFIDSDPRPYLAERFVDDFTTIEVFSKMLRGQFVEPRESERERRH